MPDQAALRPVLLRRMKEDVENLPDKEEVVVWVELTPEQRHYYRAIFAKEVSAPARRPLLFARRRSSPAACHRPCLTPVCLRT